MAIRNPNPPSPDPGFDPVQTSVADDVFLPHGYSENQPEALLGRAADGARATAERRARDHVGHGEAVYRFAARVAPLPDVVLDIGCGSGRNVARHFGRRGGRIVGVDQPEVIALARAAFPMHEWVAADLRSDELWQALERLRPTVTICSEVIECVDEPVELVGRLHRLVDPAGTLVLSSTDRERVENQPPTGPPRNAHHVREWTFAEMTRLLEWSGFTVRSARHVLPHRYRIRSNAGLVVHRAARLRPVPARRSAMVFELTANR